MTIKVTCHECGQHLEFAAEECEPGTTTLCPTCGATVVLLPPNEPPKPPPEPPPSQPDSNPQPPRPQPPSESQQSAITVTRHGPFYWGCIGAFGVMAALVIAIVGFFFLTGFPIAFVAGYKHAKEEVSQAPTTHRPLTNREKSIAEAILRNRVQQDYDKFEKRTSYSLRSRSGSVSATRSTFGMEFAFNRYDDDSMGPLFVTISYIGESSLRMNSMRVLVGDQLCDYSISPRTPTVISSTRMLEMATVPAYKWKDMFDVLLTSKVASVRLEGSGGRRDFDISERDIQDLNAMLLVYRYFGGAW